jgi:putative chitinase
MITKEQLQKFLPKNEYVEHWYDAMDQLLGSYEINTHKRICYFLAQTAHESEDYEVLSENLNYSAESLLKTFPTHFSSMADANSYAHQPEKIANRVYANRMGNGDESSGDGWRYHGQGPIQITGKDNISFFAASLNLSPEEAANYIGTFEGSVQSACWFWETNNLNHFADNDDIVGMTKVINGGEIGLQNRIAKYKLALSIFQ